MSKAENITKLTQAVFLQRRVHHIAMRQDSVITSVHARENMLERSITLRDLVTVLRVGNINDGGKLQTTKRGEELRFKIDAVIDDRTLAAIAVISPTDKSNIYVITVMDVLINYDGGHDGTG